jgi:4-hydroxybenzoate polyprenyltransferase
MKYFARAYRLINILSIDVAVGAVIGSAFFSKLMAVTMLPQGMTSLGLTVWIIYTTDHLLDARKLRHGASTARHRFHQRYAGILLSLLVLACIIDLVGIYYIRSIVFVHGLWLSLLVGIYFLVQQRIGFLKELMGAILYTAGILLIPFSVSEKIPVSVFFLIAEFGLIAWINLLLFSWIDQPSDKRDTHRSFATSFGDAITRNVLVFLFVVSAALLLTQFFVHKTADTFAILLMMNGVLFIIFAYKNLFSQNDRYRLLGDAIFFFPLISLLA